MIEKMLRSILVVCLSLTACTPKRVAPPPEQKLTLAQKTVPWRAWSAKDVCFAQPQLLAGELDAMSDLLAELLNATSAGKDGVWAEEQLLLLEEAQRALPEPLAAFGSTVNAAYRCKFKPATGLPDRIPRAQELLRQSQHRLAEAPELLAYLRAKQKLDGWKRAQPELLQASQKKHCKKGQARQVYYAAEDEHGRTEWLFCDGAKVVAVPGALPEYQAPEGKKPSPQSQNYLKLASKLPADQVLHAPKLPAPAKATDDDTPEPAEAETTPEPPSAPADAGAP